MLAKIGLICLLVSVASAANFTLVNNSPDQDVLITILGSGTAFPAPFLLPADESHVLEFSASSWNAQIWGRIDCLSIVDCVEEIPTTLVEVSITSNNTFYDISIIDGFNIKATIEPVDANGDGNKLCEKTGCTYAILDECPEDLQVKNSAGNVIACVDSAEDDVVEWFAEKCPTALTSSTGSEDDSYSCDSDDFLITFL